MLAMTGFCQTGLRAGIQIPGMDNPEKPDGDYHFQSYGITTANDLLRLKGICKKIFVNCFVCQPKLVYFSGPI
jgi:hypothetical protein